MEEQIKKTGSRFRGAVRIILHCVFIMQEILQAGSFFRQHSLWNKSRKIWSYFSYTSHAFAAGLREKMIQTQPGMYKTEKSYFFLLQPDIECIKITLSMITYIGGV